MLFQLETHYRAEAIQQQDESLEHNEQITKTLLLQRTIRSGQIIDFDGNVVIIGDINPGAEVIASGNIVVMGYVRGIVHAGAGGNEDAVIMALKLLPIQLRIADHITRSPDYEIIDPGHPEIASIKNSLVTLEIIK